MADEFLRVGGRGDDGTAKALNLDNEGKLKLHKDKQQTNTVFARDTYVTNQNVTLDIPDGATSMILTTSIYSVDGTFEPDQGLSVITSPRIDSSPALIRLSSNKHKETGSITHVMQVGFNLGNAVHTSPSKSGIGKALELVHASLFVGNKMYFNADITGYFNTDQGIEFQSIVAWGFN